MKKAFLIALPMLFVFCFACSQKAAVSDAMSKHIIAVDRDGYLEKPDMKSLLSDGSDDNYLDSIISGISNTKKGEDGKVNVVLFFHGGLNKKKTSTERAVNMLSKHMESLSDQGVYPIFINWESGLCPTYGDHLFRIRQGEISGTAPVTSPVYLVDDLATTVSGAPQSWFVASEHSLRSFGDYCDSKYEHLNGYTGANNQKILFTGSLPEQSFGQYFCKYLLGVGKIISTPVVYAIGQSAWDQMLRRTSTLFYTPEDFKKKNISVNKSLESRVTGNAAVSKFLVKLEDAIVKKNMPVSVTLIGHSMGAIAVNKILTLGLDIPFDNVVHMASADATSSIFNKVIPYLRKNPDANFYSLSLHPKNEDLEMKGYGATPDGSLLVWIDEMYSVPENLIERRSGRWENIERVMHLFPKVDNVKNRMHFKIFGRGDGYPQEHGDFDNTAFWTKKVWWK